MELDIEQDIFVSALTNLTNLTLAEADEIWYNLSDIEQLTPRTSAFKYAKSESNHGQANNSSNSNGY